MKNPQKTRGLPEVHQKLTKNVVISSKLRGTEIVIQELKPKKNSSHQYHKVVKSSTSHKLSYSEKCFTKKAQKKNLSEKI